MKLWTKLLINGFITLVLGVLGLLTLELCAKFIARKTTRLTEGSFRRSWWEVLPFGIDLKLYIFNVTNPLEIEQGHKPIVQEIGPYFFEEWRDKVNIVDCEEDDTVEFNMRSVYYFRPERSNGLTGEEEVIIPHMPILAIVLTVVQDKPRLVPLMGKAIDSVFDKPRSVFTRIKAKDLYADGIFINCVNASDVYSKGICAGLKSAGDSMLLEETQENLYRFSLLGSRNNTPAKERWRVYRGIENIENVGSTVEFDGKPRLDIWGEGHCNSINATDGSIFPPFLDQRSDIRIFTPEMCRVLDFKYQHPSHVQGISTCRYSMDFGDYANSPEDECFCKSPTSCFKKGAYDLSKCVGAPAVATLPHFYLTDESYLRQVQGLDPQKEKHEIFADFEMMSGNPIELRTRIQFNLPISPIKDFRLMENFPEAMLPVLWVEEGLLLPDRIITLLKMMHYSPLFLTILYWIQVFGGIGMIIAAAILRSKLKQNNEKYDVTKGGHSSSRY